MPIDPPCYTVGQISRYIKGLFDEDFLLRSVQIEGEISNLKYHSSGHIYFTLKDEQAAINGIMFAGLARGLRFRLADGMKVRASGSISSYERSSAYQLYARSIEEAGLGQLYQRFAETKKRLEEMGLFDPSYHKPIPRYAQRIGIVTAPTGAAIRDIVNISQRRNPYVQLILYPSLVQGDGAAADIIHGIEALDSLGLDIIIVGRGGGSLEDLWAFNEEAVARAIFDADTPIISAVGHETDVTISDYTADLRAPTPSAAAELAVFDYRAYLAQVDQLEKSLRFALAKKLEKQHLLLEQKEARLAAHAPRRKLDELQLRLVYAGDGLDASLTRSLENNRRRLSQNEQYLRQTMEASLESAREKLDTASFELKSDMETARLRAGHLFDLLAARLDGLSPLKRLGSGYSFAEFGGIALTDAGQVKTGDEVRLHLKKGSLLTQVKSIEENGNDRREGHDH